MLNLHVCLFKIKKVLMSTTFETSGIDLLENTLLLN